MTKALVALGLVTIGLVAWFGLFLLWMGARNIERSVASEHWPKEACPPKPSNSFLPGQEALHVRWC